MYKSGKFEEVRKVDQTFDQKRGNFRLVCLLKRRKRLIKKGKLPIGKPLKRRRKRLIKRLINRFV